MLCAGRAVSCAYSTVQYCKVGHGMDHHTWTTVRSYYWVWRGGASSWWSLLDVSGRRVTPRTEYKFLGTHILTLHEFVADSRLGLRFFCRARVVCVAVGPGLCLPACLGTFFGKEVENDICVSIRIFFSETQFLLAALSAVNFSGPTHKPMRVERPTPREGTAPR